MRKTKETMKKKKDTTEICKVCGVEYKYGNRYSHNTTQFHQKALINDTSEKVVNIKKQEYCKQYYLSKKDELCQKVECPDCGVFINQSSMKRHYRRKHS